MLRRLPTSAGVSSAFYGAIMSLKTLNILAEVVCGSYPPVPLGTTPRSRCAAWSGSRSLNENGG